MSDLIDDLIRDEALRLYPYDDYTGKPIREHDKVLGKITIGIGRNLTDRGLTKSEAMFLLVNDINIVEAELIERAGEVFVQCHDKAQRALMNMAFNMGLPRLMKFENMWAALAVEDYELAAKEALDSKWARQVGDRAERIADLIRGGK